jgi:hypothetical protein
MFGTRDDDDVIYLLSTMQFPLIASLLYTADIKLFLTIEEINLRRKRIPQIALSTAACSFLSSLVSFQE